MYKSKEKHYKEPQVVMTQLKQWSTPGQSCTIYIFFHWMILKQIWNTLSFQL